MAKPRKPAKGFVMVNPKSRLRRQRRTPWLFWFRTGQCFLCLCTDDDGCPEGCSWVEAQHVLCSECSPLLEAFAQYRRARR